MIEHADSSIVESHMPESRLQSFADFAEYLGQAMLAVDGLGRLAVDIPGVPESHTASEIRSLCHVIADLMQVEQWAESTYARIDLPLTSVVAKAGLPKFVVGHIAEPTGIHVAFRLVRKTSDILRKPEYAQARSETSDGSEHAWHLDPTKCVEGWPRLARRLRSLPPADIADLSVRIRQEVALALESSLFGARLGESQDKPEWVKGQGILRFRGEVVRRFRSGTVAKNCVKILDAFQEDGWPTRIDDPLDPHKHQQRLHETLRSLNKGLTEIGFHADGTGEGICWKADATSH
jgi:hypothetical protein